MTGEVKVVWLITTVLALLVALRLLAEDYFPLAVGLLIAVLLLGLVLNFSPAVQDTKWKSVGWGMFYGALLFVALCLVFIACFLLSPGSFLTLPRTD